MSPSTTYSQCIIVLLTRFWQTCWFDVLIEHDWFRQLDQREVIVMICFIVTGSINHRLDLISSIISCWCIGAKKYLKSPCFDLTMLCCQNPNRIQQRSSTNGLKITIRKNESIKKTKVSESNEGIRIEEKGNANLAEKSLKLRLSHGIIFSPESLHR